MKRWRFLLVPALINFISFPFCINANQETRFVRLEELDITKIQQGWGKPQKNASVDGNPITINGKKFMHGVGSHATSRMTIDLKSGAESFSAFVGLDDEISKGKGIL